MSEQSPSIDSSPAVPSALGSGNGNNQPNQIYLVSYPKIMFLYPTVLTAIICAIIMWVKGDGTAETSYQFVIARVFLVVMMLNLVVLAFDFPRTTSLTWFFAVTAGVIGLWMLFRSNPDILPAVSKVILSIQPAANASFYMIFTIAMLLVYVTVFISRRFDYWEVRGNELLHHHGVLSDLKRFSAPNLRIDKEINDVFEYLLLRSGRLILHPNNERRAIVLENVLFINEKEERITRMLGSLQVRVRTDPS